MKIYLTPTKKFYKNFPEYKNEKVIFLGWSKKVSKFYGLGQIRVKFGNRRVEFFSIDWFKDLYIK